MLMLSNDLRSARLKKPYKLRFIERVQRMVWWQLWRKRRILLAIVGFTVEIVMVSTGEFQILQGT
jgi:hypothetical protein